MASPSPVTLINSFEVPEGRVDECLALWREAAAVLKRQPGYIATHLHRSLNPKAKYALVNIAQWETAEHFMKAVATPEFQAVASKFGDFPHEPSLYTVVDDASDL